MAETAEAAGKKKAEITLVKMEDGREVGFAGKRKVNKDYILDDSKIVLDGDTLVLQSGAIKVRLDLVNGASRTFELPLGLLAQFAGHGGVQKYGDELASPADKPLSPEDMVLALEDLDGSIQSGSWSRARESDGFSGASVVIRAIMEASGQTQDQIKTYLANKLATAEAKGEKLTRKQLYDSFRNPASKTGQIIKRMEDEKLSQGAKFDADAEIAAMAG